MKKLKAIPNSLWFSKEAGAIRGISDIIGCINGRYIAIEVKRSEAEAKKYSPRSALQDKFLADVRKVDGLAYKCYPENEKFVLEDLIKLCHADV